MNDPDWVTLTNNPEKDGLDGYYEFSHRQKTGKELYKYENHLVRFEKRYGSLPKMINMRVLGKISSVRFIES